MYLSFIEEPKCCFIGHNCVVGIVFPIKFTAKSYKKSSQQNSLSDINLSIFTKI